MDRYARALEARHEVAKRLTDEAFPHKADVQSTHYDDCYRNHPECAFYLGVMTALEKGITLIPSLRDIAIANAARAEMPQNLPHNLRRVVYG